MSASFMSDPHHDVTLDRVASMTDHRASEPTVTDTLLVGEGGPLLARRTEVQDAHDRYARLRTPPAD